MTRTKLMRSLHKAMRDAGYTRASWASGAPNLIHYRTLIRSNKSVLVIIPGSWSDRRRNEFRQHLTAVLANLHPVTLEYATGVEIMFDLNGVEHEQV